MHYGKHSLFAGVSKIIGCRDDRNCSEGGEVVNLSAEFRNIT